MFRIRWYGPTLLLLATMLLVMLFGPSLVKQIARSYEAARVEQVRQQLQENPTLGTLSQAFKDVARVIKPSVTSISIQGPNPNIGQPLKLGNGSGWVYRHFPDPQAAPDDYADFVITNHHVVADAVLGRAEQIVVRFDDGGEYHAQIIGTDPKTDIAVLKINRTGLIPAALATTPAQQGEIVFAVGSPFQFEFSMSQGIVSATGRQLHSRRTHHYENYIQTDAAINPGNSGGPLVNVKGQVIGMNTAIATEDNPAATFSGLGFAIPIDQIINVANQLIETGTVRRGHLGVLIADLDFASANELGFKGKGVLCEPVYGGPASQAGVQVGDIITHIAGQPVTTAEALRIAVSSHQPGSAIKVQLWRRGKTHTLSITLVQDPRENPFAESTWGHPPQVDLRPAYRYGLGRLEGFTPGLADRLGWAYTPGVIVRLIADGSPADQQRLLRMSIITQVNGQPIHDLTSFAQALPQDQTDRLTLTVKRWNPAGQGRYGTRKIELTPQ